MFVCVVVAAAVVGHVGQDQFGKFPFVEGGAVVGGGTSWGLVRPTPGAGPDVWERVCEESFGPVVFFAVDQGVRGVLLGGVDGMFRSVDAGCSYQLVDNDLAGEFVSASWFDPHDADHLIIGTSTTNSDNGLWESFDGGDTFVEVRAPAALSYFNIAVSDDGEFVAANGSDGGGNNVLVVSDDGGASFVDVSDVAVAYPVVHALLFDGHDLLLGGLQATTQGFVDRVVFDGGAARSTRVGDTPREVKQAALFQGNLYVLANNGTRGELYIENDSALGFGLVDGGPTDCVFVKGDMLVGCGKQVGLNTSLFLQSNDGSIWTESVNFRDIHYQVCPEGTVGRDRCATFVELFCADDNDNDFDGLDDCADPDCDTNEVCDGEGEGDDVGEGEGDSVGVGEGEGEGDGSGEGEGDVVDRGSCCAGAPSQAALAGALLLLVRRRRPRR